MKTKIIVIIILVLVVSFTGWRIWKSFHKDDATQITEQIPKEPSINGNLVDADKAKLRPIAVVIENHSDSRPQSGLTDAEIVYETLAEGGITRFLAIFQTREPREMGPVRSARPYFNFIANMWSAPIAHAGGSKQALSELSSNVYKDLFDINESYYGDYFYRETDRPAPHNLYTDPDDMRKLLEKKKQTDWTKMMLWETINTPTDQLVLETTKITIPFSVMNYEVSYEYDGTTNSYKRLVGNKPATDKNNDLQISPKNVLVMLADISLNTNDDLGTQNIKLNNAGTCFLFRAGKFWQCKWEFKDGRHVYTDQDGNPLKFETGQTWIEIFPRDRQNEVIWK